jgi:dTDP-4-dehydrorhamnose 3,5-epimerase
MHLMPTKIAGCYRIELRPIVDPRGHFVGVFDLAAMRDVTPSFTVQRVNRSHTRTKGAIRGLHYQQPPMAEAKLVQCLRGAIFDVCVDLRPESPTYLQWAGFELSAENQELSLIPKGCAHGFQTLGPDCLVEYFSDGAYAPEHEGGLRWNDPAVGIDWPLPCAMTSQKDATWPLITG